MQGGRGAHQCIQGGTRKTERDAVCSLGHSGTSASCCLPFYARKRNLRLAVTQSRLAHPSEMPRRG